MSNNEYISENEIEEIEKVEVDNKILESIRSKNNNTFSKIQIRKILNLVKQELKENEIIEFHCVGRNYSMESTRMALVFFGVSNPIYRWNTRNILIKTNMRMICVEATMAWEYTKHYEINSEIHLVKEKETFYLVVNGDNKKTIIEYSNKVYDFIMDCIGDEAKIIIDKELKSVARNIIKGVTYFFVVFFILIILLFVVNIARHGIDFYR